MVTRCFFQSQSATRLKSVERTVEFCLVLSPRKDGTNLVLFCAGPVERWHQFLLLYDESIEIQHQFSSVLCWVRGKMAPIPSIIC